jgi:hypothetical protein
LTVTTTWKAVPAVNADAALFAEVMATEWPEIRARTANLSRCGTYRWTLTRSWGAGRPVCWVMLNPSAANHRCDDPTIRRVIHFTRSWGYPGLSVVNLYPFRSAHPVDCSRWSTNRLDRGVRNALRRNTVFVAAEARRAALVVAAWGACARDSEWIARVIRAIPVGARLCCLGLTVSGAPKHPLARGRHR